jgi:hypothetical protein
VYQVKISRTKQQHQLLFVAARLQFVQDLSKSFVTHIGPMRSTIWCSGKAATKQLFKVMNDAKLRARYGLQEAEAATSVGAARKQIERGSTSLCGGVGIRRLGASKGAKSDRARSTPRCGD